MALRSFNCRNGGRPEFTQDFAFHAAARRIPDAEPQHGPEMRFHHSVVCNQGASSASTPMFIQWRVAFPAPPFRVVGVVLIVIRDARVDVLAQVIGNAAERWRRGRSGFRFFLQVQESGSPSLPEHRYYRCNSASRLEPRWPAAYARRYRYGSRVQMTDAPLCWD